MKLEDKLQVIFTENQEALEGKLPEANDLKTINENTVKICKVISDLFRSQKDAIEHLHILLTHLRLEFKEVENDSITQS